MYCVRPVQICLLQSYSTPGVYTLPWMHVLTEGLLITYSCSAPWPTDLDSTDSILFIAKFIHLATLGSILPRRIAKGAPSNDP